MPDLHPGMRVGPWTLEEKLGQGGNSVVWRATREGSKDPLALKILKTTHADREPYLRFVREITVLKRLGSQPGVLPIIDAYLPEEPTNRDRPWLAMPIARLASAALAGASLETVVGATATFAETLAALQTEHGLGHRDIKPQNLYELNGEWLVGDFGLIHVPDLEELTRSGQPIGAIHFRAYEMIRNPRTADPHPADVYSLGKTLWVLATEERYPPEGHQPEGIRGFRVADMRPHLRASSLDHLVDTMTRLHPQLRPTKTQVGRDLRAWLELKSAPIAIDVTDLAKRLRSKIEPELADADLLEHRKELAEHACQQFQGLVKPLNDALQVAHPNAQIDTYGDRLAETILRTPDTMGSPEMVFRWERCSSISSGASRQPFTLTMGRGIELSSGGTLFVRAFLYVAYEGVFGHAFNWVSEQESAPVGSLEAVRMVESISEQLSLQLPAALEAFVNGLPGT